MLEMFIFILIVVVGFLLIINNYKAFIYCYLLVSLLLHKELFSIYMWDLLPVRAFSISASLYLGYSTLTFLKNHTLHQFLIKLRNFINDPLTFCLTFIGFIKLISIIQSVIVAPDISLSSSINLMLFYILTCVVILLIHFKIKENNDSSGLNFINFYTHLAFVWSLIGYVQLLVYFYTGFIFGALWNIPQRLARVGSLFWDTNHFGAFLAVLLPIIGINILTQTSKKKALFYTFEFFSIFGILLLTSSRSSWIIAFVSFFIFLGLLISKLFGKKGFAVLGLVLLLIILPLVREYNIKQSPFRAYIKDYFHYRIDSFDSHFMLLLGSFQIFEKYPLLGGGYGTFFYHFSKTAIAPTYFSRDPAALNTKVPAHTIWGEIFSETGILGFMAFFTFFVLVLGSLLVFFIQQPLKILFNKSFFSSLVKHKDSLYALAMFSSLVGWLTAGIFYSYKSEFFWIIFTLFFSFVYQKTSFNFSNVLEKIINLKHFYVTVIFGISLLLIFINLGSLALVPWDEAIYAQISKNIYLTGDFINLHWWPNKIWYEKPPLYMWLSAVFIALFGLNEFAVRFTSALAGVFTIVTIYYFTVYFFNSKKAGFFSSLALLNCFGFIYYARTGMTDVTVSLFLTLGLFTYFALQNRKNLAWYILPGLFFGLAVMTKGVVGLFGGVILFLYEIYNCFVLNKSKAAFINSFLKLFIVFISMSFLFLPWHIVMYIKYGDSFIDNYLGYHVLKRATEEIEDKGGNWDFYFLVVKNYFRLWFGFLIFAVPFNLYAIYKSYKDKQKQNIHLLLLIWVVIFLTIFSISKSKLKWYIMPVFPAFSIMIGLFLDWFLNIASIKLNKLVKINTLLLKYTFVFSLITVSFTYMYLKRDLIFVSDGYRSVANMIMLKDSEYGVDERIYVDRVDLPVVMFYTKSAFEVVDYKPLLKKIEDQPYENRIYFITKQSRYKKLLELYPRIVLSDFQEEWVLAYVPSPKELDEVLLGALNKELFKLESELGTTVNIQKINEIGYLKARIAEITLKLKD